MLSVLGGKGGKLLTDQDTAAACAHDVSVPADCDVSADCALPGASKKSAVRGRDAPVPAAQTAACALPGVSRGRDAPAFAADCEFPGERKSSAARGPIAPISAVTATYSALPGDSRGRVSAAPADDDDRALPGETKKSREARGRTLPVPVACAFPGMSLPTATRGRDPTVPAECALPAGKRDAPVPAAVSDVPDPALHDECRSVSVDTATADESHWHSAPFWTQTHMC